MTEIKGYSKRFLWLDGFADDCPWWWGYGEALRLWLWQYPRNTIVNWWLFDRKIVRGIWK